jgi:putative hemolysin
MEQERYRARSATGPADVARAQRLRHEAFIATTAAVPREGGRDEDAFDALCRHVLVEDARGELVCTFRLLSLEGGAEIRHSYAAQYYGLAALERFEGRMMEMGRFCLRPGSTDPDILRVAWGAVARLVEEEDVRLLFGCSSFRGTEPTLYGDAFALLSERHLAPRRWLPRVKAPQVFRFARRRGRPDAREAMRTMPPLLRFYLALGGWVSDHAVIDRDLDTLHVFTALETTAIPAARARFLRAGVA